MIRLSIPLSAKPGKHRIAVDTVDLQQTTNLESATTSLTRQYSILINLQKHIKLKNKSIQKYEILAKKFKKEDKWGEKCPCGSRI
jgi:hypothetical protein